MIFRWHEIAIIITYPTEYQKCHVCGSYDTHFTNLSYISRFSWIMLWNNVIMIICIVYTGMISTLQFILKYKTDLYRYTYDSLSSNHI